MIKDYVIIVCVLLLQATRGQSQTLYSEPAIPLANQPVNVFVNTVGTDLEDYTGDVYTHTGVILEGSSDWQHVIGQWGNNTTQPQLESLGNHLYKLAISPSILDFYSVGETENVVKMAFVFRSADAATQTADLFLDVFEEGLNVSLVSPSGNTSFVSVNETIAVEAEGTLATSISLYVDNDFVTSQDGNSFAYNFPVPDMPNSLHSLKVVATDGSNTQADSAAFYIRGPVEIAALPQGVEDGLNRIDDETITFVLHAPYKNSVFLLGDFNDWQVRPEYKLKRTHADPQDYDNRYWVTISGLNPEDEYAYQYLVDEELKIADPYAEKILDPWNDPWIDDDTYPDLKAYPQGKTTGIVGVCSTAEISFDWQHDDFVPPVKDDLIIYELLIRDFVGVHSYQTVADTLDYLKTMGVNAIELMPVIEFEGNESWGYNPAFFMAPDKYYGPAGKLKTLVDEAHSKGIAVIMDIAFNHAFGQCPLVQLYFDENAGDWGQPSAQNIWFNQVPTHPMSVGYDFNHESPATKQFVKHVFKHWLTDYHIDGFRLDLSKGFTQHTSNNVNDWAAYDASRVAILTDYANYIHSVKPQAHVILEHFADYYEEIQLADNGMLLWSNSNYTYNEASMGWNNNSNFDWVSYYTHGFGEANAVGFMESHDEERLMYKNLQYGNSSGSYNIKDLNTALKRQQLVTTFFLTIPGPKMIWQFGELGYDYSINYCPDGSINENCRTSNKPIKWDYMENAFRKNVYLTYANLDYLKTHYELFRTTDFSLSLNGKYKSIHLNHSSMNACIIGNFDVVSGNINPQFQHSGKWYEYFSGDSITVTDVNANLNLQAGEFRLYFDHKIDVFFPLGIKNNTSQFNRLRIFPNPASEQVYIDFYLQKAQAYSISVFSTEGKQVLEMENLKGKAGKNELSIPVQGIVPGIYFLNIQSEGLNATQKLFVK